MPESVFGANTPSKEAGTDEQISGFHARRPVGCLEYEATERNFAPLRELVQFLAAPLDEELGDNRLLVVAFATPAKVIPDAGESVPANRDTHSLFSASDSVSENAAGPQTQSRPAGPLEAQRNNCRRLLSFEDVWKEVSKQVHIDICGAVHNSGPKPLSTAGKDIRPRVTQEPKFLSTKNHSGLTRTKCATTDDPYPPPSRRNVIKVSFCAGLLTNIKEISDVYVSDPTNPREHGAARTAGVSRRRLLTEKRSSRGRALPVREGLPA
jgi:hypothetical protein